MKLSISALIFVLSISNVFAQAERACPGEKLNCKLEKQLSTGGRTLIGSSVTEYDGTNSDEPSIPPSSCSIRTSLEDSNGVIFNISIDEVDQMADIYLLKRPNLGSILAGDTAFTVTKEKAFYYRYNDSLLTCTLSK